MMSDTNKYLFDLHNFDSGFDFDPDNPPAPTFSEEELTAARADGFAEGVKKGLADGQASRDQQIVELTRKMTADLQKLLAGETLRNRQFEQELIALVQALYQKTFPILNAEFGLPQVSATISAILGSLEDASLIGIEVAPQDVTEISDRLKPMLAEHTGQVSIFPQSDVEPGSFRIKWKDGGAIRDVQALAQHLTQALATTLAGTGQTSPK